MKTYSEVRDRAARHGLLVERLWYSERTDPGRFWLVRDLSWVSLSPGKTLDEIDADLEARETWQ